MLVIDQQGADGAVGGEAVFAFARCAGTFLSSMICRACARSSACRPGPCARRAARGRARLSRRGRVRLRAAISLGVGRGLAMPGLVLFARGLGHLGLLDQAGLEQLFLQRISLCHDAASYWGYQAHHTDDPRQPSRPPAHAPPEVPHRLPRTPAGPRARADGAGRLGAWLAELPRAARVRNDGQLYDYVQALKDRHLRKSVPLGKVVYDGKAAGR